MTKTKKDKKNCFLIFNNQYRKNKTFIMIKNGTPKLSTDKMANVFGATKGNTYESNKRVAATELKKNTILFIKFNFFMWCMLGA